MATTALITTVNTSDYSTIKTLTSAERKYMEIEGDLRWYGTHPSMDEWMNDRTDIVAAIIETTGEDLGAFYTRMAPKVDRSFARRQKESAEMARKLGLA